MKTNSHLKGIILVLTGAMLWGVSGTAAQYLFQNAGISAEWLVVIRLLCSGLILILFGLLKKDDNIKKIWTVKEDRIQLVVFSIFGMLGVQYTYFAAIKYSNAATATILQYLAPVVITIYLFIKNRRAPGKVDSLAIILAMIGTFFIITRGNINSISLSSKALFWGILSAFCSAIYTMQPVSLIKKYNSIPVVGFGMLIGGVAFSFVHAPWNFTGIITPLSIALIIFVVLFGTLIAFCLYLASLKYLVPTETSILGCMEPLSATFLSIVLLHTPFGIPEFIGTACIITTVIILSLSKKEN